MRPGRSAALRMERAARAGDIVVSPQTAALLPARALGAPAGGGRLLRSVPAGEADLEDDIAGRSGRALAGRCVSTALRAHLGEGEQPPEHRIVTFAFLRFGGTDSLIRRHGTAAAAEALDELVSDVQRAADDHEVAFLGSDVDVDGGKLLLCAGAPRVAGDDEERMLAALRRIMEGRRRLPVQAASTGGSRSRATSGRLPAHLHGDGRRGQRRRPADGPRARRARSTRRRACSTARAPASRPSSSSRSCSRARPGRSRR